MLLRGRVDHIDGSTGELIHRYTTVHEPGGLLPVACKTRRASRCAPCAEVYRADTNQLIPAGLTGGKASPPRSPAIQPCSSPSPHRRSVPSTPGACGATGYWPAVHAGTPGSARTVSVCPATRNTPATMTGSASRKAFRAATIVDEIIRSNPVERAKRPRAQTHEPGTVWTVAQLRAFLATAPDLI